MSLAVAAPFGRLGPGVALAAAVAVAAYLAEPAMKLATGGFALPAMVLALIVGMLASGVAARPAFEPGLTWCVKKLLRYAIALLGLRIALADIVDLGLGVAVLVVASMALTIAASVWLARLLKLEDGYGALAGAANAVCGASATLATSTVVPNYATKARDVAFTVVAANLISTVVMLAYPPLAHLLGYGATATGIFLGATIQDMAQVVGAGYAVSEPVGNSAVIVKLYRVFLLLPVVVLIGWWFLRRGASAGEAKVPMPVFALVFLALCLVNSAMPLLPALQPLYAPVKAALSTASTWGLLIAISALGLGTSVGQVLAIGWRHAAVFCGAGLVILAAIVGGLAILHV
jgi:uncharacterized integral membrane protein (TIGR00698 family)